MWLDVVRSVLCCTWNRTQLWCHVVAPHPGIRFYITAAKREVEALEARVKRRKKCFFCFYCNTSNEKWLKWVCALLRVTGSELLLLNVSVLVITTDKISFSFTLETDMLEWIQSAEVDEHKSLWSINKIRHQIWEREFSTERDILMGKINLSVM